MTYSLLQLLRPNKQPPSNKTTILGKAEQTVSRGYPTAALATSCKDMYTLSLNGKVAETLIKKVY